MPLPRSKSARGPFSSSGNLASLATFSTVGLDDEKGASPAPQASLSPSTAQQRQHLRITSAPGLTCSQSLAEQSLPQSPTVKPFFGVSRYVRALFTAYIAVSVLYTMTHFYSLVRNSEGSSAGGRSAVGAMFRERSVVGTMGKMISMSPVDQPSAGAISSTRPLDQLPLTSSFGASAAPLSMLSSQMLYSKMFQYALQPTHIVPYFYRMSYVPTPGEIGVVTMITVERLSVVNKLVMKFKGPISVALHINDDETKLSALEVLQTIHDSSPMFAKFVDVHLIVDRFERQFNLWRNVARLFARTELIMSVDVDFMLCSDLRSNFARLSEEHRNLVINGTAVFVVPAFEFSKSAVELDVAQYPADKTQLIKYAEANEISMFHQRWKRGHAPTNYAKWYKAKDPYPTTEYNYNYEPYVLMKRDGLPWCDERFVGYGANKAACLYEIYLAGVQFWVLPEDFLIHQRHPYPENDRRIERKYNKRLYDAYREEACLRYGRMASGAPNDTKVDERICGANFQNYYGL